MAEKAVLLNKLPPVAKKSSDGSVGASSTDSPVTSDSAESEAKLLSSQPSESNDTRETIDELSALTRKLSAPKSSAESQARESRKDATVEVTEKATPAGEQVAAPGGKEASTTASTVEPAEATAGIGMLQVTSYASFVLTFILAGFAAVVLFRKATKVAEQRFVISAKVLGGALGVTAMHGFFATFLYTSFLRNDAANAPLALTGAIWILLGGAVGVIVNHLLTPKEKPKMGAVAGDVIAYASLFALMMVSLSPGVSANTAIILSLLAGLLLIVPIARATIGLKIAKFRHPELNRAPEQALLYSLLLVPALAPIVTFLHACGAFGVDVTLLLLNFTTFDFILFAGIAMTVSADDVREQATEEEGEKAEREVATAAPKQSSSPEPQRAAEPAAEVSAPKGAPPSGLKPKKLPPHKPGRTADPRRPEPPQKPNRVAPKSDDDDASSPNAPSRVKAPSKPKKRF